MDALRTALIGCGKVGHIHAEALRRLPESQLVGVCDRSEERAKAFAESYGTVAYTNLDTLLRDSGVQVVVVCTHASASCRARDSGCRRQKCMPWSRKPLASTLADCDAMLTASKRAGTQLGVISQRRYLECVQRMRAAIDAGKIGRPMLGVFSMFSWRDEAYYRSDPWRGKWSTEGGGVLVNQSPHGLDLLQWFMRGDRGSERLLGQP